MYPEGEPSGCSLLKCGSLRRLQFFLTSFSNRYRIFKHLCCQRLWAFNWHTECTRPYIISSNTQGTTYAKQNGVEIKFAHAVVILQGAADGIHIRCGVLGLALFF